MRIYDIHPTARTVIDPAGREAPIDPMRLEPRIPRGATRLVPPATGEREAARWTGEAWEVVLDWRGHVYWTADGQRHEITNLGEGPPTDAIDSPKPSEFHEWDGNAWVEDTQAALEAWRATASVTARQGEQQLILADLDEKVEAAIDAIEDTKLRKLTRAWYNRASTWERNNPEFIALGEELGLTPEEMDEHIKSASEL